MAEDRDEIGPATPATDLLENYAEFMGDAALLRAAPAKAALLERMAVRLEGELTLSLGRAHPDNRSLFVDHRMLLLVAEHRNETPEATLTRLAPPGGGPVGRVTGPG